MLLGDLIEMQFLGSAYNPYLGSAIALVMMIIVLICMLIMNKFGEGEETGGDHVNRKPSVFARIFTVLVFLFLYAPIFVLIAFSFNSSKSRTVWTGFTFDWYAQLFHDSNIMGSVYTTLLVSVLAALIATIFGTIAAIGFYNMKKPWRSPLMAINNIPVINADIVTGVSLCLLFVFLGSLLKFQLGFGTLLIAHITFNIPYVILSVMPKLYQLDRNLVDAAQDLGCTWIQAFCKVVIPQIIPGIINGAIIAFTMSIDDFIISYFTAGSKVQNAVHGHLCHDQKACNTQDKCRFDTSFHLRPCSSFYNKFP